jgi:putative transposase
MKNQENITKCIGALQQSYTQYHHIKWNSAGKLWQGRFKSQPVEKEKYLYECGRYIERNPMRAGMVKYPWDYKWSSCSVYVKGEDDGITTVDPLFYAFGKSIKNRRENYKAWLMEGEQDLFSDRKNGVGDKDFAGRLIVNKGRFMARRRGRPSKR